MRDKVVLKATKKSLIFSFDDSPFDEIQSALRDKIESSKDFFGGTRTNVLFRDREFTEEEEQILYDIMMDSNLIIDFIGNEAYIQKKEIIAPNSAIQKTLDTPPPFSVTDNQTHYHKGSLRSGNSIKYDGSVVILGDVNAGSEVIATGNIVVFGKVRGMLHAGCKGNKECYISALSLQPTQIRFADIITAVPPTPKEKFNPAYAYVEDDKIYISNIYET